MKTFFVVVALLCLTSALPTSARQVDSLNLDTEVIDQSDKEYRRARRAALLIPRHQFRLSVLGVMIKMKLFPPSGTERYAFVLPPFTFEYSFRAVDFLEIGVGAGYSLNYHSMYYDIHTDEKLGFENSESLTLSFTIRYNWLNRKSVSLYSSIGVWADLDFRSAGATGGPISSDVTCYVYHELVPFGVRFGRKFFGFVEPIGFSARGYFGTCGIGYRF